MSDIFAPLQLALNILLAAYFHRVQGNDVCREQRYLHPVTDKALVGHVTSMSRVHDGSQCELRCYTDHRCLSYNLGPYQDYGHTCELSNSDHIRHPDDLVPMPGYIYRGTENLCSSSTCPNNATCLSLTPTTFQCLCPAGFTGTNCETDIDECQTNQHHCLKTEICVNTAGSYWCRAERNCQDIKTAFPDAPDGMYLVLPDGAQNMFWAYCDMTSFDGGWTMCYSTDNLVSLRTEVTYDENLPYGTNGYRTDCNNIEFREILFVDEETGEKAFFAYKLSSTLVAAENYRTQLELWSAGGGVADPDYTYQLLICDHSFYSGFFISGYTNSCKKDCDVWCSDNKSPYFRSASTSTGFGGVAFNVNGHRPLSSRLISVGLR